MRSTRRMFMGVAAGLVGAASVAWWRGAPRTDLAVAAPGGMTYREFGRTGMKVSETGFGAWAIGGKSYGAVDRAESLRALARAEELGCNLVDTARVYGDSELVLGEFLRGRRARWLVATKYTNQPEGMEATLDEQLRRLGTDYVDFYQIHWAPDRESHYRYDDLERLKRSGRARFVGVSLYSISDIDYVLDHTDIDGFQVAMSLLDPDPLIDRLHRLRDRRLGIIVRSSLKEGFLAGKFARDVQFTDPDDLRSKLTREQIDALLDDVERFRFLEVEQGSMAAAAARYPLSFPEVSTVILGTKTLAQAGSNFGEIPGARLSAASLRRITRIQNTTGIRSVRQLAYETLRRLAGRN